MKKRHKIHLAVILFMSICCVCSNSIAVNAGRTYNYHRALRGIGNYGKKTRGYTYSQDYLYTVNSKLNDALKNAIRSYNNAGITYNYDNPTSLIYSSEKKDTVLRFYISNDGRKAGYNGYTKWYSSLGFNISPYDRDWSYAKIVLNMDTPSTESRPREILSHEIGHGLGLDHNNDNTESIMCQESFNRRVSEVQLCDLVILDSLYQSSYK